MVKTVFQAVVALVELAELLMGGGGNGEAKKNSVVEAIKAFFSSAGFDSALLEKLTGPLVDFIVYIYNAVGKFKKAGA